MDAAEYKHLGIGLIFVKYTSDAFDERRARLLAAFGYKYPPDRQEEAADTVLRRAESLSAAWAEAA